MVMNKLIYILIANILTIGLVSCSSQPDPAAKINIENHGVHIAYTDNGKSDTTLLFVHGWCINKSYWSAQVAFFSKKYRVVTIDLPGFGESGKNRSSWNSRIFGKDVNEVINQLKLKHVILIGHSMAGDIVLQSAINAPKQVIGIVGVDNFKNVGSGAAKKPSRADEQDYANAISAFKHHFKTSAADYVNHYLFYKTTSDEVRKRVLNDVSHADSVIATACLENDNFDERAKLLKSKKKIYLINSDYTPTDTSGLKADGIHYQVFYMHDTGHFPMVEKPNDFNVLLAQVLKGIK